MNDSPRGRGNQGVKLDYNILLVLLLLLLLLLLPLPLLLLLLPPLLLLPLTLPLLLTLWSLCPLLSLLLPIFPQLLAGTVTRPPPCLLLLLPPPLLLLPLPFGSVTTQEGVALPAVRGTAEPTTVQGGPSLCRLRHQSGHVASHFEKQTETE